MADTGSIEEAPEQVEIDRLLSLFPELSGCTPSNRRSVPRAARPGWPGSAVPDIFHIWIGPSGAWETQLMWGGAVCAKIPIPIEIELKSTTRRAHALESALKVLMNEVSAVANRMHHRDELGSGALADAVVKASEALYARGEQS